jgi:pyrroline-5-carboxylate reductase
MSTERTLLIGGGKMGEALLGGWIASQALAPSSVTVIEPDAGRRRELTDRFAGVQVVATLAAAVDTLDGVADVVVAVKPQYVEAVCREVAPHSRRVLSIAAGVTIARMAACLGSVSIVRAMPNTPALVGTGASALAGGPTATDDDLAWATRLLGAVGVVEIVGEPALDAVTGLSGSGPAYVFLIAEALIDAGVSVGLGRATSTTLALQTLLGAARMLADGADDPATLRANVTSPGGTTAAGVRVLEQRAVRAAIVDAVHAAAARSRELGST